MMSFLIKIVLFAVSAFLLAVSARYGLIGARKMDGYFSQKNNSNYPGFQWYYRIPFSFGVVPEYFYAIVLGHENYFTKNWWALKTASFISILVFIAGLKSRSMVSAYFSFGILQDKGIIGLFTSGNFVNFLNIIVLLYVALFVLICIESIRMHGVYAPVRIVVYSMLSLFMANITVIALSIIVFVAVVYVVIKIIGFLFSSSRRRRRRSVRDEEEEETAGTISSGGYGEFKTELYQWEEEEKSNPTVSYRPEKTEKTKRKRPKITRRIKRRTVQDDEIPRLYPD